MSVDQEIRDSLDAAMRQRADAHFVRLPSVESVRARAARQARRSGALAVATVAAVTLAVVVAGGLALTGRLQSQQHVITPSSPSPTPTISRAVTWPRPVGLLGPGLRQVWDGGVSAAQLARGLAGDVTYEHMTASAQRAFRRSLIRHGQLILMVDLRSRVCLVHALDVGAQFDDKLLQLPHMPWQTLDQGTCSLRAPHRWSRSGDAWLGGRLVVQQDSGVRDVFSVEVGFGGHRPTSFDPYHEELRLWLVRTTDPDPVAALRTKALYTLSAFTPTEV